MTELRATTTAPDSGGNVGNPTSPPVIASPPGPTIIDAVRDASGNQYFKFGTPERSVWFSGRDLTMDEKSTFLLLNPIKSMFAPDAKNKFKKMLDGHSHFRDGVVANTPGWCGNHYVLGNGRVISREGNVEEVIVTFAKQVKFDPLGTVKTWRKAVGPLVANQPIPLAGVSLALVGPLMRYVPTDFISPMIEFVGKRESGKTTAALLAASVWAGRGPSSKIGGAESWKTTVVALDGTMARHRDSLLVLDEANLAGTDGKKAGTTLADAVMALVAPQPKMRFRDSGNEPHADLAILSTSNMPLRKMFEGNADVMDAVESRSMPVEVKKHSMLRPLPDGYETMEQAVRDLRRASSASYGTLGPHFVECIIAESSVNEAAFRAKIARELDDLEAQFLLHGKLASARHRKSFCMLALSARLATQWKCIHPSWGAEDALFELHKTQLKREGAAVKNTARSRIERYAATKTLINPTDPTHDSKRCNVNAVPGFAYHKDGSRYIVIGCSAFRRAFRDHAAMLKELANLGLLKTEGGQQPKKAIKAPTVCARKGRAYCIVFPLQKDRNGSKA